MDAIPRDYEVRCLFNAFCKTVLRNEAKSYLSEMKRRRDREVSLGSLSQADSDKLFTVDHYPNDSFTFSSHGCDLHIDNELVAEAFATLPSMEQSILILHCVMELAGGEIGALMGMSRSAVQRHRTKTLFQYLVAICLGEHNIKQRQIKRLRFYQISRCSAVRCPVTAISSTHQRSSE